MGASEATKTANYIAKCTLEDKLGIPITVDIVACSPGLKGLYQNIVNTILGNPTEEIDEDLLSEIGNDLARYFNDQPIGNGGQSAPTPVSWREFVSTPVSPTLDDAPPALDYSNLVSLFNQGEAASFADYETYNQNTGNWFTNGVASVLNSASSALGNLHDSLEEKAAGGDLAEKTNFDLEMGVTMVETLQVSGVTFTTLDSGKVSVSACNLPEGMRADYFNNIIPDEFNLHPGGNYLPETITARVNQGLLQSATDGMAWGTAGLISVATNLIKFGTDPTQGDNFNERILTNQEFYVSTAVDTVLSVAIGYGLTLAATAALAAIGAATVPLLLPVLAIGAAGIVIGMGLDALDVPDTIKGGINSLIDKIQGET